MPLPPLSHAAALVRAADRERFVTALFAPPDRREALMTLLAFNIETGRVRDQVREPLAGLMRLAWWEEGLAGGQDHPLLDPLARLIEDGLPRGLFAALIEARRRDLDPEPLADLDALEARARAIDGGLGRLMAAALGGEPDEAAAAEAAGIAWGLVGGLRALPFELAKGRATLPRALCVAEGFAPEDLLAGRVSPERLAAVALAIGARAATHLERARAARVARSCLAALLPAVPAAGHLARLRRAGGDPFSPMLAVARPRPLALVVAMARRRV